MNHWWFLLWQAYLWAERSVLDIVRAINQQDDHVKNRNYWKYLKTKLKKENSEVVSGTNQLKNPEKAYRHVVKIGYHMKIVRLSVAKIIISPQTAKDLRGKSE